jgi:hypothetical protein
VKVEKEINKVMTAELGTQFAKEQQEKARQQAIEMIKKSEDFLLVIKDGNHTCVMSGMPATSVPYFLGAIEKWLKSTFEASVKHVFPTKD